jgi:hypothetical protein
MAQSSDFVVDDGSGVSLLSQLNSMLPALASSNSGASAAPSPVGGMLWFDNGVAPPVLRMRNNANTSWLAMFPEVIAANTLRGNPTGSSAVIQDVSMTQLRTMLGFAQTTGNPRRLLLPGGMMLQGGTGTTSAGGSLALTFPFAFSATPTLLLTPIASGGGAFMTISSVGSTGATVLSWVSNAGAAASVVFHYFAFGEA